MRAMARAFFHQSRYRERAQALSADYARYDAVKLAVETVEGLIAR